MLGFLRRVAAIQKFYTLLISLFWIKAAPLLLGAMGQLFILWSESNYYEMVLHRLQK